jgi:antagonist of KipI
MLEVIEPGLLTTVQDAGRTSAVDLGVPVSGACDGWSLGIANVLAGNAAGDAALEMTLLGATFRVVEDCRLAVAGADMAGPIPVGESRQVRAGEVLAFGPAEEGSGVRTYLAIAGGVDVPVVLGSRSTCLVAGFGGLDGRPLRAGDSVAGRRPAGARRQAAAKVAARWPAACVGGLAEPIRMVRGPDERTTASAFEQLLATTWVVGGRSDRQGIRLDGPTVTDAGSSAMLSQGVTWGTVQLPPDGAPIVLLADHQTVGGYPVIGVVISADRRLLGQLGPGDEVRFTETSVADAQRAIRQQSAEFDRLRAGLA